MPGDHALLEVGPLLPLHTRSVTVRTKAGDTLSADSLPCLVPDDLVHGTRTPKVSLPSLELVYEVFSQHHIANIATSLLVFLEIERKTNYELDRMISMDYCVRGLWLYHIMNRTALLRFLINKSVNKPERGIFVFLIIFF